MRELVEENQKVVWFEVWGGLDLTPKTPKTNRLAHNRMMRM